jgi:hypothetical protein
MPVNDEPQAAGSIAVFGPGPDGNTAAGISYNLPLPGEYTFQRIVPVGIPDGDFSASAASAGTPLTALGVVQLNPGGGISQIDGERLLAYYSRTVTAGAWPSLRLAGSYGENVLNPALQISRRAAQMACGQQM